MRLPGRPKPLLSTRKLAAVFAVAATVSCVFCLVRPAHDFPHMPPGQENGPPSLSAVSLCGGLPLTAVARLIPKGMVFFQNRWRYMQEDWGLAVSWLKQKEPTWTAQLCDGHQQMVQVLLYFGAFHHLNMTGLDGSPQGEQLQWHDLYVSLLLLGYHPVLLDKPRRLTADYLDAFDVIVTDYLGVLHGLDKEALAKHRCKLRVLDSWGTDQGPNQKEGWGFCCLNLPHLWQFWTFTPEHSPENSFLGYTVKSFRRLDEFEDKLRHRSLEVLLYGKEYKFFNNDMGYVEQLATFAPTHATAMGWPNGVLSNVQNHGVMSPEDLHKLMQQVFAYAGFAAVMMGPASIEATSQGMVFLNYAFVPPRNQHPARKAHHTAVHQSIPFPGGAAAARIDNQCGQLC